MRVTEQVSYLELPNVSYKALPSNSIRTSLKAARGADGTPARETPRRARSHFAAARTFAHQGSPFRGPVRNLWSAVALLAGEVPVLVRVEALKRVVALPLLVRVGAKEELNNNFNSCNFNRNSTQKRNLIGPCRKNIY